MFVRVPNVSCRQELEEPTEEQISQAYQEESMQISTTLASIPRSRLVANTQSDASTSLLDLSGLVDLRAAHETLQAHHGVRNASREIAAAGVPHSINEPSEGNTGTPSEGDDKSEFRRARQQIIKQFYQLLRDADAEGERVGTGLHRSHIWTGANGNTANAEQVAECRTNQVRCFMDCRR